MKSSRDKKFVAGFPVGVNGAGVGRMGVICCLALGVLLAGCGTGQQDKKEEFFTSGSREADQRASRRMAREKQLQGSDSEAEKKEAGKAGVGGAALEEGQLTLYERLGGEQGLVAIMDDFIPRAMADPRVNWGRKGVDRGGLLTRGKDALWQPTPQNVAALKKHMVQFFSLATGGPTRYEGKEMKAAHAGMRITNPQFDAVVGDLKASLDRLQIPDQEQKELLAVVESTRPQVVSER